MIKARHIPFYVKFFDWYIPRLLKKNFRETLIIEKPDIDKGPVLLIGNHISWWDGFWGHYLNHQLFHKRIYVMMLEEQLTPRMFLNKVGAFSIQPNSKTVKESLDYTLNLLHNPDNMVLFYPQGKIQSIYEDQFVFSRGITYLLKNTHALLQFVFYACLVDYASHKKPSLYFYLKNATALKTESLSTLQKEYNDFYSACITKQKSRI